jgi:hypothetical protein
MYCSDSIFTIIIIIISGLKDFLKCWLSGEHHLCEDVKAWWENIVQIWL